MEELHSQKLVINEETLPFVSQFAECIPGGFFIYHAFGDQELIYFNSRMPALFGCDSGEEFKALVGNSFKGIVHPDEYDETERSILEQIAASEDKVDHVQYRFIRKDGSIGMIDDYGHFSTSEAFGDIYYVFVQDITDQQEQQRIRKENERVNRLIENLFKNYLVIYRVDLSDASYSVLKTRDDGIDREEAFSDFTQLSDFVVSNVVYKQDQDLMRRELDIDAIRERLAETPRYSVEYRAFVNGATAWHEMVITSLGKDDVAIGYAIRDAEILVKRISQALMDNFEVLYAVNFNEDQLKVLKARGFMEDKPPVMPYSLFLEQFISGLTGEAKEHFQAMTDVEYDKRVLQRDGKSEFYYISPYFGEPMWFKSEKLVLTWADGMPETALIGITKVDHLQREKMNLDVQLKESSKIIGALAEDFGGVTYVELTDEKAKDIAVGFRTSELMKRMVPNWEQETSFSEKISLLLNHVVYEPDRPQFYEETRREYVMEKVRESQSYIVHTRFLIEGEIRYYEVKFSPVQEDGEVVGFVVGLRSIDAQRKKELEVQKQLEDALFAAQAANRAKTEFLFNMSHDIRTPMNAILGFTGMGIKHIDDKQRVLDCLTKTQQSGNLLLTLINEVLDMSRIESGNAEYGENAGDVMLSFANIETTMHAMAATKGVDISFGFGEVIDRYVYADFSRCVRIFTNLISNAIKYTPEGGHVWVLCEQAAPKKDGFVKYRYIVKDDGIGMSKEFQEHMFESFTREQTSTVSGIQGTGLGLSVCKTFVDFLGGTIECESAPGKGTMFAVTLPFRVQETEHYTDPVTGEVVTGEPRVEAAMLADFSGKRVLLVEDNELNREIATDILEEEGFVVDEAVDGTVAVDMLREKGPDAYDFVLMDIQMPVMNGYDATRAIRAMYPDAKLPIIAVSANAFDEDRRASKEAGMDDHVAKPIDVDELKEAIARFL